MLEDRLGVQLIARSTLGLRLTAVGNGMLEQAQRGVELSEAVDRLAAERASGVSGRLRLAAPSGLAETLLAPVAAAFAASHPAVELEVFVSGPPAEEAADRADVALRLGALQDSSLIALRLLRFRKRLVASPDYVARHGSPAVPADLVGHRVLTVPRRGPGQQWRFTLGEGGEQRIVRMRPRLMTDDAGVLVAAALAGVGLCDLAPVIRPDLLLDGRLVEVMPDWRLDATDLSLVTLARRHVTRSVRLFKAMAARMIPSLFPVLPG